MKKPAKSVENPELAERDAKKSGDLEDRLKRALADYQNLEKRFARESSDIIRFANAALLSRLLELKDNLERAAQAVKDEGVTIILRDLDKILKDEMVTEIETQNKPFDPEKMEADEAVSGEKDKVIDVVQKGYMVSDRVLRPARVRVGNGQSNNQSTAHSSQEKKK